MINLKKKNIRPPMYWGYAIYCQGIGGLKWNLLKKLWKSSVSSNTLAYNTNLKRVSPHFCLKHPTKPQHPPVQPLCCSWNIRNGVEQWNFFWRYYEDIMNILHMKIIWKWETFCKPWPPPSWWSTHSRLCQSLWKSARSLPRSSDYLFIWWLVIIIVVLIWSLFDNLS